MATQQYNFFGYRITDNATHEQAKNVTAAFVYRGYDVAFNTFAPSGMKVAIYRDNALISEHASPEAAIVAIDEMIEWRRGSQGRRLPVQPGWQTRRAS